MKPTLNTCRFHYLLLSFRVLDSNDLTELSPGIFDSLASLETLYVLSLVVEISFPVFF